MERKRAGKARTHRSCLVSTWWSRRWGKAGGASQRCCVGRRGDRSRMQGIVGGGGRKGSIRPCAEKWPVGTRPRYCRGESGGTGEVVRTMEGGYRHQAVVPVDHHLNGFRKQGEKQGKNGGEKELLADDRNFSTKPHKKKKNTTNNPKTLLQKGKKIGATNKKCKSRGFNPGGGGGGGVDFDLVGLSGQRTPQSHRQRMNSPYKNGGRGYIGGLQSLMRMSRSGHLVTTT